MPSPSSSRHALALEEHRSLARERLHTQLRTRQSQAGNGGAYRSNSARNLMGSSSSHNLPRSSAHGRSSNSSSHHNDSKSRLYRSSSARRVTEQSPQVPLAAMEARNNRKNSRNSNGSSMPSSSSHHREDGARMPASTSVKVHHHDPSSGSGMSDSSHHNLTAKERLEAYKSTKGRTKSSVSSQIVDAEDATVVQYLAVQAYHLPGYTWRQDWWQFMLNNHPVLGICFHHPLHPIKSCTRVVALIGSLVVGLALTNLFYLFYLWNPQFNQPLVQVSVGEDEEQPNTTTLTTGMLLLWTLGGGLHATYNLLQWYIAACACCRPGGICETKACCPSLGKHLLRVLVSMIIGMAVLIILLRVAIVHQENEIEEQEMRLEDGSNATMGDPDATESSEGIHFFDDDGLELQVHEASEFEFLVGYAVEMVLALFVYYPIGGTIIFSGILVCGRMPILGGRPYEIRTEERRLERQARRRRKGSVPNKASSAAERDDSWSDGMDVEMEGDAVMVEDGGAIPVEHYRAHRFN